MMEERIMLKMEYSQDWIIFRTMTRSRKSVSLYVRRDSLFALKYGKEVIAHDGSFAVFTHSKGTDTVSICFYWVNPFDDGTFTGWRQDLTIPYAPFMAFLKRCGAENRPKVWRVLSLRKYTLPRFVFISTRNLREALADKLTRRKLCKFLRDNFHWHGATEIRFYDDYVPRSFFFREMRNKDVGICGGLILHGQEDMAKAYYSIHT